MLAIFVLLTGLSVSYSVQNRAETAQFDSLQGLVYGIISAANVVEGNQLVVNEAALPDTRLNLATNGLYAEIIDNTGRQLWASKSITDFVPPVVYTPIGQWTSERVRQKSRPTVHRLQLATVWELDNGEELPFIVQAVADAQILEGQLRRFDRTLWTSLLASVLGLLLVQLVILHISLKPLRTIGSEVGEIEQGHRESLSEQVPTEIKPLTSSINALLISEKNRHQQYRHLLDDLAHSLKTPLSVLNNMGGKSSDTTTRLSTEEANTITTQTEQMQSMLNRYLQRAALRTPQYLTSAASPLPAVQRICESLSKIYASPAVRFNVDIDESFLVRVPESDLFEILGNVLENACKYGATDLHIQSDNDTHTLLITDNGPGFPEALLSQLTRRGVRADTTSEGQGLGLAASFELMKSYGGELKLANTSDGSAKVSLHFA